MFNEGECRESFEIYVDKKGKHWIWCDALDINVAIRQPTLDNAYKAAMESLLHSALMYKESRDELREDMDTLRKAYEIVFGEED